MKLLILNDVMESLKTKWAIVGLGKIAHKFAQDLQTVEGVELYAVASRDLQKAIEFGEKYNVEKSFGSYEELLQIKEIDIIYIATPHVFHTPLASLFIGNKFSVLCEKPISMNEKELTDLIKLAKENNVFLMEGIWTRFFPTFIKMFEIVESGVLGEITTIRADFGFHSKDSNEGRVFNKKLGGGAILDVGIYPLFLSLLTLGEPDEISTFTTFTSTGVDASDAIILKYGTTAIAELYCSIVNETDVEGEIFGSKGKLKLHSRFHHAEKLTWEVYGEKVQQFNAPYTGNGYQYEIKEVHNCLLNGQKESELLPLALSLKLTKLMDSVRKSANLDY